MTTPEKRPGILVIDDEPQILESIHGLLEDDFDVVTTSDPTHAIDILRHASIAVILADQRMPQLSGDQFLAQASQISEATRVLITGYVDIDALIRAVNDGQIHSYVPKPWNPRNLRVTVLKAAARAVETNRRKRAAEIVAEQQAALARSEQAYRDQTKLLQSVLDGMSDGVMVADENGRMLMLNPAAKDMVDPGTEDTLRSEWGHRNGVYLPGTDTVYPADQLPLARALRGETADGIELFVRNAKHPGGISVSVNARPLRGDSGEVRGGVAVVRDITAAKSSQEALRKSKEEAERANRAKSEFLSRMSHELRTPLNSILGFAQLLALALPEQHQSNVQHILSGGYHLLDLINEVLDLSRIEAGRLRLSMESVTLEPIVREALDLAAPLAANKHVTLHSEVSECVELQVAADPQRLKQVLLNLLSNAIKFNRPDGQVYLTCRKADVERVSIEVADTGEGMDEAGLRKIFTPFERLDADRKAVEGTGLGLSLSKRMIEAMGGTMGVTSTPGEGSTFYFDLALSDVPAAEANERNAVTAMPAAQHAGALRGTVLYIEDNPANTQLIAEIIGRFPGVTLLQAADGERGIEVARTRSCDWILLDMLLPDISGEEVLRRLQNDEAVGPVPVTMLSADATPDQVRKLLAAGARDYLTKPIDVREFVGLLETTLKWDETASANEESHFAAARQNEAQAMQKCSAGSVDVDRLPSGVVEQMLAAVGAGQKDRLDELITGAADQGLSCAQGLRKLADNYDYDALTSLLSAVGR